MRTLLAPAAALLLASCYDPGGQCKADADCLADQVCGADGLCVVGVRPPPGDAPSSAADVFSFSGPGPFDVSAASGVLHNDSDPGGAALSAELVADATYGQVWLAPDGSFTYAPIAAFDGTDTFTYRASNGARASGDTTVTLSVRGPPVAVADAYAFTGAGPFSVAARGVLANDTDPRGAALSAKLVSNATNGQVALAADGSFTYTPAAGFTGTDRFTYRATTGTLDSDATAVTIAVGP
jgi:hypothetical protein